MDNNQGVPRLIRRFVTKYDPDTFTGWLVRHFWKVLAVIFLPGFFPILLFISTRVKASGLEWLLQHQHLGAQVANLLLIFAFLWMQSNNDPAGIPTILSAQFKERTNKQFEEAMKDRDRLRRHWQRLLLFFFISYVVSTFSVVLLNYFNVNQRWFNLWVSEFAVDTFSNLVNLELVCCYIALLAAVWKIDRYIHNARLLFFLIILVHAGFMGYRFLQGEEFDFVWGLIFQAIWGIGGAVTLSLLVGRWESRYFSPPLWVVLLLYAYSAFQVAICVTDPLKRHLEPRTRDFMAEISPVQSKSLNAFPTGTTNLLLTAKLPTLNQVPHGLVTNLLFIRATNDIVTKKDGQSFIQIAQTNIVGYSVIADPRNDSGSKISVAANSGFYFAAALFKALFFLFAYWLINHGALAFYFIKMRSDENAHVEGERRFFLESIRKEGP